MKEIYLMVEGNKIPAVLNDTKAARDFEKRLPFQVICHDSGVEYMGLEDMGIFTAYGEENKSEKNLKY